MTARTSPASGSAPADTLQQETVAASQLLALLEQEQTLLVEAKVEELGQLTMEKAKAIAAMSELANRRYLALGACGFDANETGMRAWTQSSLAGKDAVAAWEALLDLAARAKEQNRVNGLLITQQMARNQQALNILTGSQPAGTIYGPKGQTTAGPSGRRLGVG
jgi:flagellar biosynthesis protein FlgN